MNRLHHFGGLLIVVGASIIVSRPAWGQRSGPIQLRETVDRLVPYDLSGPTAVALSPVVAQTAMGLVALDDRTGLALPGQPIEGLPRRFRPVIRPLDAVTEALVEARGRLTETLAELGEGPTWAESPERELGLLVDGSINLIDLARYVLSAREAGFERFVLLGRRSDGQLATISAEFGSVQRGPDPSMLPQLRVAPRDVTFESPEELPIEIPRDELTRLGQQARPFLAEGRLAFAAQARPMMPLRMVLPSIDAVAAASERSSPVVLFMLPP